MVAIGFGGISKAQQKASLYFFVAPRRRYDKLNNDMTGKEE